MWCTHVTRPGDFDIESPIGVETFTFMFEYVFIYIHAKFQLTMTTKIYI